MKRFTKAECLASMKSAGATLRITHPGGEVVYHHIGSDGEWWHFYNGKSNRVWVMKRKQTHGKKGRFPRLEDMIHGDEYTPE